MRSYISPKNLKKIKKSSTTSNTISTLVSEGKWASIREGFIAAIAIRGSNERGEKINLSSWYVELLRAIADLRIGEVYVTGIAQNGKTLAMTNLILYLVMDLKLNALWAYDLQASLNIQVPSNFRPVADHWIKNSPSLQGNPNNDRRNNTIFQLGGGTIHFTYVSTSAGASNNAGRASAGGIAVGVNRDIIFKEERSQYPLGADAPLNRRLDAGRIPTKPVREFGTPGSGAGIELQIKDADHHFFPYTKCSSCGEGYFLHPMGCLLKQVAINSRDLGQEYSYLSPTGRPVDWHHHDEGDPVNSAYFACSNCHTEISSSDISNCWYQCLNTGIRLEDYLTSFGSQIPSRRARIGISISALLKRSVTNRAAEIIYEGLNTQNTVDWQQQMLGIPAQTENTGISLELLKAAIGAPIPEGSPDFVLGGIDCGRGGHWYTEVAYYLPVGYSRLSLVEVIERSIRYVRKVSLVDKNKLPSLVQGVDYGIVDNEPDRDWATRFCNSTVFEMADQKSGLTSAVKLSKVIDGGIYSPCWFIRNEKFLKYVRNGFILSGGDNYPLYRFPSSFLFYLNNLKNERNFFRHLMSVSQDSMSGKWIRPNDGVDDYYYSLMFNEVAFYIYLQRLASIHSIGIWKFS